MKLTVRDLVDEASGYGKTEEERAAHDLFVENCLWDGTITVVDEDGNEFEIQSFGSGCFLKEDGSRDWKLEIKTNLPYGAMRKVNAGKAVLGVYVLQEEEK